MAVFGKEAIVTPTTQRTTTIERPLEVRDLAVLRALRASLFRGVCIAALGGAVVACALAFIGWMLVAGGIGAEFPAGLAVALVLAAIAAVALYDSVRHVRLFRRVSAILREPRQTAKNVSRGELTAVSREQGRIHYEVSGEAFDVWLPVPLADTGKLEFEKSVPRLDGLLHRQVVLEWLRIEGAPRLLLLDVDYPDDPPAIVERAPTAAERRAVAWWDHIAYAWFMAAIAIMVLLVAGVALFAYIDAWMYSRLSGGLLVSALPIGAIVVLMWGRTKRWLAIQPRTLVVTGLIAEVLDKTVSIGRYSRTQRWYRIGDRLYATRQEPPEDNLLVCGTPVRVDYVDRSPLGGWIVRIELSMGAHQRIAVTGQGTLTGQGGQP
jgi:hypothetical protein